MTLTPDRYSSTLTMSSGRLENVRSIALTGVFQNPVLNQEPGSSGFLFDAFRVGWIPASASMWLVWSLQYSDGNRSPQNWLFLEYNPVTNKSFEYSVSTEQAPYLARTIEPSLILARLYVKRWVYSYSPTVASTAQERRNVVLGQVRFASF